MNILVFVKRVPDTESRIRIQHETHSVVEDGLNFVISPYDEFAVEEALRLREAKGGAVTVVSVGRDEAMPVLRKCLAMGADEAVLIKDEAPETYDGLRTARIIARAVERPVRRDGPPPLRQAGRRRGQRPGAVHGRRAPRPAPGERGDEARDRGRARERPTARSRAATEKVVFSLPAVVSAQKGLNEPRYETLKGIMAAKKKDIPVVRLEDLGLAAGDLAPMVVVTGWMSRRSARRGRSSGGIAAETARELAALLHAEAKVI